MNQQQRKYAIRRLEEIAELAISKAEKDYWQEGVRLTTAEKLEALASGDFVIESPRGSWNNWHSCVKFTGESLGRLLDEGKERVASIKKELASTTDVIMLGDNEEALRLIKEFTDKFGE